MIAGHLNDIGAHAFSNCALAIDKKNRIVGAYDIGARR
jgi:hypothetical protein